MKPEHKRDVYRVVDDNMYKLAGAYTYVQGFIYELSFPLPSALDDFKKKMVHTNL